jgi:multidrug efflux system membrane fusion protein
MVFVGAIPQSRVDLAKLGLPVEVTTINGAKAEGKVTYIAVSADPATRSFLVEAEFPNPNGKIRDGLTAEATVNLGTMPAHLLPQSIMTLDSEGTLGVQTVEDGKVVFHQITILQDTRDGVWVTGLPASADIIVLGQEYVTAGQMVDATKQE